MAQTEITNDLPFEFGVQHLLDYHGTPVAVGIIKATFTIAADGLRIADEQMPLLPAGKPWGEPGKSSYQYEPECSYYKLSTDTVLIGAAVPPFGAATQVEVSFSIGSLRKRAMVFGDRFWTRSFAGSYLSSPEPFESMPLVYERAFGGWDRSDPDPDRHTFESRNPVGTGFAKKFAPGQDRIALPNVEDPSDLVTSMDSRPNPVGFGFINPDWRPRASLAGTYDSSWAETRAPLLPEDFDPRFFNAASPGLKSNGYLLGNEQVAVQNCAKQPILHFHLPSVPPPLCRFRFFSEVDHTEKSNLDTVVVNTLDNVVVLTWRCYIPLPRGPESLVEVHVTKGR